MNRCLSICDVPPIRSKGHHHFHGEHLGFVLDFLLSSHIIVKRCEGHGQGNG